MDELFRASVNIKNVGELLLPNACVLLLGFLTWAGLEGGRQADKEPAADLIVSAVGGATGVVGCVSADNLRFSV